MDRLLQDYRYYLRVERHLSPNTVAAYCSDLEEFFAAVGKKAREIKADDIERYFIERSVQISKRSQARALSALRSFFDWTVLEGERKENPCDHIDAPKLGRYLPEVLSVEEIDRIIASVAEDGWIGVRDRAIL